MGAGVAGSLPSLAERRIGIVDDDKAVRDSLCILLDTYGFGTAVFPSAAAFLSVPCDYDCVVADHSMPVTSGLEMLELLRMSGIATPAILMMDKDEPALTSRIANMTNCTSLLKPIAASALICAVTAACAIDN